MTAPNSPSEAEKAVMPPASRPGSISGRRDAREAIEGARAQSARRVFEPAVDVLQRNAYCANHQREGHHRGGERGAVAGENELDAEGPLEPSADRSPRAEQEQQYIAYRDRRQHQRQVHHGVEQRMPQEAAPRQNPCDQERGGQADGDAAQGDAQAEAQRFAFVGAQPDHGAAGRDS